MKTSYCDVPEIYDYIKLVEGAGKNGKKRACLYQKKLVNFVKKVFETENLTVKTDQLSKYMGLQKYFDFGLFKWEKFIFTLHCCLPRRWFATFSRPVLYGRKGRRQKWLSGI